MSTVSFDPRPLEEAALFNPAFLALVAHDVAAGYEERSGGRLLPVALEYLALPLTLHGPTRRSLPRAVSTQMIEWIQTHPEARIGLATRARALRPLVSDGLRLAIGHAVLRSEGSCVRAGTVARRPRGLRLTDEVEECRAKAGLVGRWFANEPDMLTIMALWGLRP